MMSNIRFSGNTITHSRTNRNRSKIVDQSWFEMRAVRRRKFANAVWIPLRAIHRIEEIGRNGHAGYRTEFYGVGTLAVPTKYRRDAEKLGWSEIGIRHQHSGGVDNGEYFPADTYNDYRSELSGIHLVLNQAFNSVDPSEWHLHQDLVIALGLKREGDVWVCPDEGYESIARFCKREDGTPYLLEIRSSHLRDYLCAREMGLYVTAYRERVEIREDIGQITWAEKPADEVSSSDRWRGRVMTIHEGGMPYGKKTAVIHVARTDVDPEEDVPVISGPPTNDKVASQSWTVEHSGTMLHRISGELWRTEWIEPLARSPIVRGDDTPPTVFFITDAEGKQENRATLVEGGRWLWFRPEVMTALSHRRGGSLNWYTRDTGKVGCSPDSTVRFGVNSLGLINVYAKDIAFLPEWVQKIWSGYNISPEGRVSDEMFAAQVRAVPANTHAPERFLNKGLSRLNDLAKETFGIDLFRPHKQIPQLITRAHRFRATDQDGLFALAKDLTRLTADSLDTAALKKIAAPPQDTKWGSLKLLQNLLATKIAPESARKILSPLFWIYDLRLADAHLPKQELGDVLSLLGVDQESPHVIQGYQLLHACVSSIYGICQVIEKWCDEGTES